MSLTVLIDGDSIPYSVGYAAKGEPLNYVLQTVKSALQKIQDETGADKRKLFIKGDGNFREDIAITQPYKGNRKTDKPPYFLEIVDYLVSQQGAIRVNGMEADDMTSVLLYEDFKKAGGDKEVCTIILSSIDKDLNCTPGWHHNPRTGEVYFVTENQASRHFWYQMLAGDRVDNIKGLPELPKPFYDKLGIRAPVTGLGDKTAKSLMALTHTAEAAELLVMECYLAWGHSQGFNESDVITYLIEQAQLLWMVRELDELGNPVMYTLNEDMYEKARKRSPYQQSDFAEGCRKEEGATGYGTDTGDSGYSSRGREGLNPPNSVGGRSENSDEHAEPLRVQPTPHSC